MRKRQHESLGSYPVSSLRRCSAEYTKEGRGATFWLPPSHLGVASGSLAPLTLQRSGPAHGDTPLGYVAPSPFNWSGPNGACLLLKGIGQFTGRIAMQWSHIFSCSMWPKGV